MYYQEIIVRFKARPNYQHIIAPTKQKTSRCECFKGVVKQSSIENICLKGE